MNIRDTAFLSHTNPERLYVRALQLSVTAIALLLAATAEAQVGEILWDPGSTQRCFAHVKEMAGCNSIGTGYKDTSGCAAFPRRSFFDMCGDFDPIGGFCPLFRIHSFGWGSKCVNGTMSTDAAFGQYPGWDYWVNQTSSGTPIEFTSVNNGYPICEMRETAFDLQAPYEPLMDMALKRNGASGPNYQLGQLKHLDISFEAKKEGELLNTSCNPGGSSVCFSGPKAWVTVDVVIGWDGPNFTDLGYNVISVVIHNPNNLDYCNACSNCIDPGGHILYHEQRPNGATLSLAGKTIGLPPLSADYQRYEIDFKWLSKWFSENHSAGYDRLYFPTNPDGTRRVKPDGKPYGLDDAVIRTVQIVSSVSGANLQFKHRNMSIIGR